MMGVEPFKQGGLTRQVHTNSQKLRCSCLAMQFCLPVICGVKSPLLAKSRHNILGILTVREIDWERWGWLVSP